MKHCTFRFDKKFGEGGRKPLTFPRATKHYGTHPLMNDVQINNYSQHHSFHYLCINPIIVQGPLLQH
jgi:hypothetical protein